MAQPTQLNPTDQDALVKQIGLALLRAAPADWEQVTVYYRAVGGHQELTGEMHATHGGGEWPVPQDIARLFARLREGMYREGRGSWFNARYQLDRPSSYNLEYDRDEPVWSAPPPAHAYADELRMFPRSEDNVPDWLMRRLAGLSPERPGPHFRIARVFDGMGPSGRPVFERVPVTDADREELLAYLTNAPIVVPGHGFDIDRLDPDARPTVPVAFQSDGTWIWPAAVEYYLRSYEVPPEPDLVDHIRAQGFRLPQVDEETQTAAARYLSGSEGSAEAGAPVSTGVGSATVVAPVVPAAPPVAPVPVTPPVAPPVVPPGPAPQAATHAPSSPVTSESSARPQVGDGDALGALATKLAELGVPDSAYRIGPPAPRTWTMEQVPDGWRVGWFDSEFVAPAHFEDASDASAFLLGKLLLDKGSPRDAGEPVVAGEPEFEPEPVESTVDSREPVEEEEETVLDEPSARASRTVPARAPVEEPTSRGGGGTLIAPLPDLGGPSGADTVRARRPAAPPPVPLAPPPEPVLPTREQRDPVLPPREQQRDPIVPLDPMPPREHATVETARPAAPPPVQPPPVQSSPAQSPASPQQGAQSQRQEWPIKPMSGEPPLTLFRGKRMSELEADAEIDRFGDQDGNLVYAAGTPFAQRSLVPEWIDRPYRVYRTTRSLEVLTGIAIPWFDQPGGGTAYLLPGPISELVADGFLEEVPDRRRPH
ncbi:uncharacterized protein DUF4237 [Herbihabitans rhizosphaerae]|uniref:Uncharacterized protein DUF4237 n=1 Tax=Herbihabitans rhizosphaerae TaxID=1872711 RepID=A0A4Q7KK29_9PSEU|nr:TNT domain-containing protein [Herbihabitans rhizosphaerae]RZS36909.1 uncharacterized protein DUF4237 [Herbihabitans rhizosphaerae]